ncbi:hypothetical protein ATY75_04095 [Rhizobium sp. N122]|uniref:hypothetical protein n=1 Tax=Rhizobium sp. N122 TaxID=1764272 RepID=UPI000B5A316F|nr:hypothetical protein [Rhizobium sp. N122]OWV83760.1 hypothetical protein ATY75_04095 [Rhizobium sp. N122]
MAYANIPAIDGLQGIGPTAVESTGISDVHAQTSPGIPSAATAILPSIRLAAPAGTFCMWSLAKSQLNRAG